MPNYRKILSPHDWRSEPRKPERDRCRYIIPLRMTFWQKKALQMLSEKRGGEQKPAQPRRERQCTAIGNSVRPDCWNRRAAPRDPDAVHPDSIFAVFGHARDCTPAGGGRESTLISPERLGWRRKFGLR